MGIYNLNNLLLVAIKKYGGYVLRDMITMLRLKVERVKGRGIVLIVVEEGLVTIIILNSYSQRLQMNGIQQRMVQKNQQIIDRVLTHRFGGNVQREMTMNGKL